MNKLRLDVESITVETFTPQTTGRMEAGTTVCTRWDTCTNCNDPTCIC